jgi:hypothetical protein
MRRRMRVTAAQAGVVSGDGATCRCRLCAAMSSCKQISSAG